MNTILSEVTALNFNLFWSCRIGTLCIGPILKNDSKLRFKVPLSKLSYQLFARPLVILQSSYHTLTACCLRMASNLGQNTWHLAKNYGIVQVISIWFLVCIIFRATKTHTKLFSLFSTALLTNPIRSHTSDFVSACSK